MTSRQKSTIHFSESSIQKKESTLYGQLQNGLTYYITENSYDGKQAALRLAVKVGSVLEEEEERGLAHFLEHMVFRGTKSYLDGEVIGYLESIGAAFGADTNAYTTYDHTVYLFDIPLEKEGSLETAVSILSEFAMKANLSEEQLEIEKNVVLDELRLREGSAFGRSSNKTLEMLLEGSLYAERHPIGLEDVIRKCSSEKMRKFYTKWYRPERMAIIVAGDFSKEEVKAYIDQYFGALPTSADIVEVPLPTVGYSNEEHVGIYKDPEQLTTYFLRNSWVKNRPLLITEDFRYELLNILILAIANRRFAIRAQEDGPPFQSAFVVLLKWLSSANSLMYRCVCWDQEPMQGLEAFLHEVHHMLEQSFTAAELQIALDTHKMIFKTQLENAHKHHNRRYAAEHLMHFLDKGSLLSFEECSQLYLSLLDTIELEEINVHKNELLGQQGRMTLFVASAKTPDMSEAQISAVLAQERSLEDKGEGKDRPELSLTTQFAPGCVTDRKSFQPSGIKKWILSNEMHVYLEKTSLKDNLFSLTLKAKGGLASYDAAHYPSAASACSYLQTSGLAGLSNTQLQDALAGKHAQINYMMLLSSREVHGETSNDDMEVAFKLMHALFTDRFYREEAWNQNMKLLDQMFASRELNPDLKFYEEVKNFEHSGHYFVKPYNSTSTSRAAAEKILQESFKNPSEYVLVVVGDYQEERLARCLEKYLASIPTSSTSFPSQVVTHFEFPAGIHQRDLQYNSIGNASTILWSCPIDIESFRGEEQDFYHIELAENIIKTRLFKKLRSEAGETYSVWSRVHFPFTPDMTSGKLIIYSSAAPEMVGKMKALLLQEIHAIIATPPTVEEITAAQEIYKHHQTQVLQNNEGRAKKILEHMDFGSTPETFFTQQESTVSQATLHDVMRRLLNISNYSLHTKLPN